MSSVALPRGRQALGVDEPQARSLEESAGAHGLVPRKPVLGSRKGLHRAAAAKVERRDRSEHARTIDRNGFRELRECGLELALCMIQITGARLHLAEQPAPARLLGEPASK